MPGSRPPARTNRAAVSQWAPTRWAGAGHRPSNLRKRFSNDRAAAGGSRGRGADDARRAGASRKERAAGGARGRLSPSHHRRGRDIGHMNMQIQARQKNKASSPTNSHKDNNNRSTAHSATETSEDLRQLARRLAQMLTRFKL